MSYLKYKKMQKKSAQVRNFDPQSMRREIRRGCEEEREGSPILIFPPLNFRIMRMLAD